MSNVKHRIILGNLRPGINNPVNPVPDFSKEITLDSTRHTMDSEIVKFYDSIISL